MNRPGAYLLFHLNLAFSSIGEERRGEVVERCYWPLLRLARHRDVRIGVELTGYTLREIERIDAAWVDEFRALLDEGRCELVGSGWAQVIGPLVPYEVNRWNQHLGLEAYRSALGHTPRIVLVNEMAFSSGLVDVYARAGYGAIVMDRDNVRLALDLESQPLGVTPTHARGTAHATLPVLWGDSNLFQWLQRVVHQDKSLEEYLAYLERRVVADGTVLPLYCNDAEVFDFRPGRFQTEAALGDAGEWERLVSILDRIEQALGIRWLAPSDALTEALALAGATNAAFLNSTRAPIPVKKQAKYNVNRWSVTGRDDLGINTGCHDLYQGLVAAGTQDPEAWRELCELWSSDLRTHITEARFLAARQRLADARRRHPQPAPASVPLPGSMPSHEPEPDADEWRSLDAFLAEETVEQSLDAGGILWQLRAGRTHLTLNLRRGLTLHALGFAEDAYRPLLGTIPQGYFDSIEYAADFYSGGVIAEVPATRTRYTDLERVSAQACLRGEHIWIRTQLPFAGGTLEKRLILHRQQQALTLAYRFGGLSRPMGSLRVGILTFLHANLPRRLSLRCRQGGPIEESFPLTGPVTHALPASALVSSSGALSGAEGRLRLCTEGGEELLRVAWDPSACAAMPLLTHQLLTPTPFTRLKFSLTELDDTLRGEAPLCDFTLHITRAASTFPHEGGPGGP